MSTDVVLLDNEKASDTTWHPGVLYELSELQFSISLIKLIASYLKNRKFNVSAEGALSSFREIAVRAPQGSVRTPVLYNLYINDASVASETHLALFADDTCIYATEKSKCRDLCKLQRGLTSVNSWCERWSINVNEGKTRVIYFSRRRKIPEHVPQLKGRNIPFLNNIKYFSVIYDRRMIWRVHIEHTTTKALGMYIGTYYSLKSSV
jgi:hypothetical protein